MSSIAPADLASFVASLEARDELSARAVATSIIAGSDGGVSRVLDELIPQAMQLVGQRWESGEWTVAQEHAATDICDGIVSTIGREIEAADSAAPLALVVCAEGEWHSLASRSVAVSLSLLGWQVELLGPSVSSSQLAAAIFDWGPGFVAMTCSMIANLPGASRMIATARETRTPILVGGRAFGDGPERAQHLGADGWAHDSSSLAEFIAELPRLDPPANPAAHYGREVSLLQALSGDITMELSRRLGIDHALEGELAAGGVWMLRTLHAALLCDDRSLLIDYMRWHEGRARLEGALPAAVVIRALLSALPEDSTTSHQWLEDSALDAGVRM